MTKRILEILAQRAGTDFSNYKSATIERRLKKRLSNLGINSIEKYIELLESDPDEADEMFKVILIGVTRFFRDTESWCVLERHLAGIIELKKDGDDLRIWVPACSTGEEAFTIAILANRLIGKHQKKLSVQIFASDIDGSALIMARKGVYSEASLEYVPLEIREEFFVKNGENFEVIKEIRKDVLFLRHDITQNPPLLRLDLISCRNLFIYFSSALQKQLLSVFHFALNDQALLFLGKSETTDGKENFFKTINSDHKIFSKKQIKGQRPVFKFSGFKKPLKYNHRRKQSQPAKNSFTAVDKSLLEIFNYPYVVVTDSGVLLQVHGDVQPYLRLPQGDVKSDFLKMINPDLRSEVHPLFLKAIRTGEIVQGRLIKFDYYNKKHFVKPLMASVGTAKDAEELFVIVFQNLNPSDVAVISGNSTSDNQNNEFLTERLLDLENELFASREHLQSQVEQLEIANEELQSLNEELESSNEEFNATNEELEVSNEEIQSSYEELNAANERLERLNKQLDEGRLKLKRREANFKALLNNKLQSMILADRNGEIRMLNETAVRLLSSYSSYKTFTGKYITNFFSDKVNSKFKQCFKVCLEGDSFTDKVELSFKSGADRTYVINGTPVTIEQGVVTGVTIGMLDVTDLSLALKEVREKEVLINSVFNIAAVGLCVTDENSVFVDCNQKFLEIYGYRRDEIIDQSIAAVAPPGFAGQYIKSNQEYLAGEGTDTSGTYTVVKKDGTEIIIESQQRFFEKRSGSRFLVTSVRDITAQVEAQEVEKKSKDLLQWSERISNSGSWEYNHRSGVVRFSAGLAAMLEAKFLTSRKGVEIILKFIQTEERKKVRQIYIEAVKNEGDFDFETKLISQSGKRLHVRSSGFVSKDEKGYKTLYCVFRDLTEEYHLFSRLKSFAENLPGLAFRYCLFPDGSDKITYIKTDTDKPNLKGWQGQLVESENLWNRVHQEDRNELKKLIEKSAKSMTLFDAEWRSVNKKGKVEWVRGIAKPVKNENDVVTWDVLVLNIEERKRAEAKRKLTSSKLRLLVNGVEGIVWEANPENFKFIFVSNQVNQVLGYAPEDWYATKDFWQTHIHPDDREHAINYCKNETNAGRNHTFEYRMRKKNGEYIWIEDRVNIELTDGKPVLMRGIMLDVTHLKKQNKELALLGSVVKAAKDSIIITDAGDGNGSHHKITYVNDSLLRLTGYSRDEVMGKSPKMFQGELTDQSQLFKIKKALQKNRDVEVQVVNYHKSGVPHWIEIVITPIKNKEGVVTHYIAVQREISQIKLADLKDKILAGVSQIFNHHDNLPDLLTRLSGEIAKYPDADFAETWLVNYNKTRIVLSSSWGKDENLTELAIEYNPRESFKKGVGLPGLVWQNGKPIHLEDTVKSEFSVRRVLAKKLGVVTVSGIPMMHGDEVVGVLMLGWKKCIKECEINITLPRDIGGQLGTEIKRKQAEKELVQLFDTSRDIICVIKDDKFIKLNNAAAEILGHSKHDLFHNPATYYIHSEDLASTQKTFNQIIKHKKTINFQNRFLAGSGEERWFDWTATPGNDGDLIFAIGRDITERIRLEKLLDNATNLAKLGGWIRDIKSNQIEWSANTRKIHEVKTSFQPTDKNISQFFTSKEDEERYAAIIKRAQENHKRWDEEFEIKTGKGNLKWIRTIGEPEVVAGHCVKITGSIQDIDKLKRAELGQAKKSLYLAMISRLNVELLHSDKWIDALGSSLPQLSKVVNADRVYYFSHKGGSVSQELEWCAPGVEPQIDNPELQNVELDKLGDFASELLQGKPYNKLASEVKSIEVRKLLEFQGINSILVYPVMVNDSFKGFIGFDACTQARKWDGEELELLKSVTHGLSIAIQKEESAKALELANKSKGKILESITDAFYSVDENFNFTYFNHEAENLLGRKSEEVIGKNIWKEFPLAAKTDLKTNYDWVFENQESTTFEYLYPKKNTWFEVNVYPAKDGLSVYFKDITERIFGFRELALSKERFERVAEATNDAIWDWNIKESSLFKGKGFETLFGHNAGVFPCEESTSTLSTHPEDKDRVNSSIKAALENRKVKRWSQPYRFKRKDGTYASVIDRGFIIRDKKGRATRMVGSIQDVTRQKEYEESLKTLNTDLKQKSEALLISQKRYSDLFHLSPQPMIVFDIKTLEFLDANAAAVSFYGYTKQELMGLKVLDIKPEDTLKELEAAMKLNVKDNPGQSVGIATHKKKSGETVTVDIRVSELDFKGRRARLALVIDVTERFKYINAIEEKNKQLMDIAWKQSHLVRAPLARMLGLIDMFDELSQTEMSKEKILEQVCSAGKELDQIIRNISQTAEKLSEP